MTWAERPNSPPCDREAWPQHNQWIASPILALSAHTLATLPKMSASKIDITLGNDSRSIDLGDSGQIEDDRQRAPLECHDLAGEELRPLGDESAFGSNFEMPKQSDFCGG